VVADPDLDLDDLDAELISQLRRETGRGVGHNSYSPVHGPAA
jgi:hypothetical protein